MSHHKSEIRRAMRDGHPPIKAVQIAHAMRKMAAGGVEGQNEVNDGPNTSDENEFQDEDPTGLAHGGVKGHPAGCACEGCAMAKGGVHMKHGHLTAASRNHMAPGTFAGPDRSYPIPDAGHARNALARASGKPVEAQVRAKVHAKFPGIGK